MNENLLTKQDRILDHQHPEEHYPNFLTAHDSLEKYLKNLPENLFDLSQSFGAHDVFYFKQLINKMIPELKSVGLNEIAEKLKSLDASCITARDMVLHEMEIETVIKEISASRESTSRILNSLKEFLLQ